MRWRFKIKSKILPSPPFSKEGTLSNFLEKGSEALVSLLQREKSSSLCKREVGRDFALDLAYLRAHISTKLNERALSIINYQIFKYIG
jgi:hypothetical protein